MRTAQLIKGHNSELKCLTGTKNMINKINKERRRSMNAMKPTICTSVDIDDSHKVSLNSSQ
jgi:hypothetical protein